MNPKLTYVTLGSTISILDISTALHILQGKVILEFEEIHIQYQC